MSGPNTVEDRFSYWLLLAALVLGLYWVLNPIDFFWESPRITRIILVPDQKAGVKVKDKRSDAVYSLDAVSPDKIKALTDDGKLEVIILSPPPESNPHFLEWKRLIDEGRIKLSGS